MSVLSPLSWTSSKCVWSLSRENKPLLLGTARAQGPAGGWTGEAEAAPWEEQHWSLSPQGMV